MSNLGMGVILGILGGNEGTVNALKASLNKVIAKVWLDGADENLKMTFQDGSTLRIWDGGQSCCESRYMRTDDDLNEFVGAVFTDITLKDAPSIQGDYGDHEVQFLEIQTDKGVFTMSNHNEHNGYYGGFYVQASL